MPLAATTDFAGRTENYFIVTNTFLSRSATWRHRELKLIALLNMLDDCSSETAHKFLVSLEYDKRALRRLDEAARAPRITEDLCRDTVLGCFPYARCIPKQRLVRIGLALITAAAQRRNAEARRQLHQSTRKLSALQAFGRRLAAKTA